MQEIKISIIVPVYKTEKYLERCVDSLLGQTYENMEIILVDDGSPDGSPALCDRYAGEDERIKVLHKENRGLVSAWQAGVRQSSGEYLCFVDSDDWVEKEMLRGMAAYLTGKSEIVCCNFVINRPGKQTEHFHELTPGVYEGEVLEGEIKDNLLGHENRRISMSRCMKLFSRELIENNMKYCASGITMGEDVNIVLPALLDCERVVIMKDALYYHYFYNESSMVHKYDEKMYAGILLLSSVIADIFEKKGRVSGRVQRGREHCYLLLLVLKNEIRGGRRDYILRSRSVCRENRELVKAFPIEVRNKVQKLLYLILRKPNKAFIIAARLMFFLYDGRRR